MLDMGFYIGITGWICDERRAEPLREAVSILPLDRVLLETDAPYLTPRGFTCRGRMSPIILLMLSVHWLSIWMFPSKPLTAQAKANTENCFACKAWPLFLPCKEVFYEYCAIYEGGDP